MNETLLNANVGDEVLYLGQVLKIIKATPKQITINDYKQSRFRRSDGHIIGESYKGFDSYRFRFARLATAEDKKEIRIKKVKYHIEKKLMGVALSFRGYSELTTESSCYQETHDALIEIAAAIKKTFLMEEKTE